MTSAYSGQTPRGPFVESPDIDRRPGEKTGRARALFGLAFAALIAATGLMALVIEATTSLSNSFALQRGLGQALYLHFRYFTIQANWGVAILMIATIVQGLRRRPLPRATLYGAALVYIIVVGVTYEALLRATGMRMNIFFFTDLIMHDIVPLFYAAFWLGFAPKRGLTWRDAVLWLGFPFAFFALTLVAGAFGEGYPYFFMDTSTLGYRGVVTNALIFLLAFYVLGLGAILLSRMTLKGLGTSTSVDDDGPDRE